MVVETLRRLRNEMTATARIEGIFHHSDLWRWAEQLGALANRMECDKEAGTFTQSRVTDALWAALTDRRVDGSEKAAITTRFLAHLKGV